MEASGRRIIQGEAEAAHEELVNLRAGQCRLGVQSSSLIHEDKIPVAIETDGDGQVRFIDGDPARAAGQVDDWIGLRPRRARGNDRDDESDCAAAQLAPILRDYEVATAGVGQCLYWNCRAGRRFEARHHGNACGG